jgi:succinate dehydrogenase / fumarate reductase cytochrome b subunit
MPSSPAKPTRPRPLSPHLQIYKFQLTAVLSITHRFTGLGLVAGLFVLAWWLIAAASGPSSFATINAILGSWFGRLCLLGWTVALFYHLANGIRHLFWDMGYGFDLPSAYASGYAVLGATAVLTLAAWAWGLA